MPARGRFITFEGIDGAGKSTQLVAAAAALRARGLTLVQTREPGGTPLAEALRELVLRQPMAPLAETLLVFAARADHVQQVIAPALARGDWVLCDRFTDATWAYQAGGRGLPAAQVEALAQWVHPDLQPDLTVLFDVPPAVAAGRLAHARAADRFEAEEVAFFTRVRSAYLALAAREPGRFVLIDAAAPPAAIGAQVSALFAQWGR